MLKSIGIHRIVIALVVTAVVVTPMIQAQTWQSLLGPPKARNVKDIAVSNDGQTLYACDTSVLFKSVNGGASWASTGAELSAPLVVTCRPDSPNTVVAGVTGYIKRNTDGGQSGSDWQNKITGAGTPLRLAVSPLNYPSLNPPVTSNNMWLGRQTSSGSPVMFSQDGGATWDPPSPAPPTGTSINDIAPYDLGPASEANRRHVWIAGSDGSNEGTNPNSTATTRGVWRSTNSGADWTGFRMGSYNVKAIAIASSLTPPRVYAGTASGKLFESANYDSSWTEKTAYATATGANTVIRAIRIRPVSNGIHIFVASNKGIHRSTNYGSNWSDFTPNPSDPDILSLSMATDKRDTMFATTAKAVYKTTNGGSTWTEASTGLGRMPISYVTGNGSNYWTVSRTFDSLGRFDGSSWTTTKANGFYGEHIMRNSSNGYVFASGIDLQKAALYRSTDQGQNYQSAYTSASQGTGNIFKGSMVSPVDNACLYVWGKDGTTANFYKIANHGTGTREPYTVGGSNPLNTINDVATAGTQLLYYGLDAIGVWRSTAGPSNGNQILSGMTIRSLALNASVSTSTLYAAGPTGLRRTTNAQTSTPPASWSTLRSDDLRRVILSPGAPSDGGRNPLDFIVVLTNDGNNIYFSADGGTFWTNQALNLPKPIYDLHGEPGSPAVVYAATDQGAYRIISPTQTATTLAPPSGDTTQWIDNVTFSWNPVPNAVSYHFMLADNRDFNNPIVNERQFNATQYVRSGLSYFQWYYWRVAGNNVAGEAPWKVDSFRTVRGIILTITSSTSSGGSCNVKVSECNPKLTWTLVGVPSGTASIKRKSVSCGANCGDPGSQIATQAPPQTWWVDQNVWMMRPGQTCHNKYCYNVTVNGYTSKSAGVNSSDVLKEMADGVEEGEGNPNVPRSTRLEANFPNPFNPVTEIRYALKADGDVRLALYDVLGREVQVLVSEHQSAGYKSVEFNAGHLPSGIYFYRLTAGSFTDVKKMVLAR